VVFHQFLIYRSVVSDRSSPLPWIPACTGMTIYLFNKQYRILDIKINYYFTRLTAHEVVIASDLKGARQSMQCRFCLLDYFPRIKSGVAMTICGF